MEYGAITGYIDVAQVVLYAFWIFFAGLIYYLHRENKREGYPLVSDNAIGKIVQGFPTIPAPKAYHLHDGRTVYAPRPEAAQPDLSKHRNANNWIGEPIDPVGNPMVEAVGPGAYAMRQDAPDMTWDARVPKLVPLRADPEYHIDAEDPDPRGMPILGVDNVQGGTVVDVWVDRSEVILRYLEVEVAAAFGGGRALVPMTLATISDGAVPHVRVVSITGAQFSDIPGLSSPDQVTLREEDQISAYFGGGTLYATPSRVEPLI